MHFKWSFALVASEKLEGLGVKRDLSDIKQIQYVYGFKWITLKQ